MSNTQYIIDAIEQGIERVKIVVNGVVTEANAKEALEQFYKPTNQRRGYWVNTTPYNESIHGKNKKVGAKIVVEESSEEIVEESNTKKTKKQKNESDESEGVFNIPS
jgi:hypothetical protein